MRLAALLAQFLYQHKKLDLPGLGTFVMDQPVYDEAESSRHSKNPQTGQIRFETNLGLKDSPELVSFISAETGKIRALASADLESHLELAHQFLNIGKPFSFEGIGNLVKIKAGEYSFIPGPPITEFKKEQQLKDTAGSDEDYNYKNIFYPKQVKSGWKKPVAVFLLVAGLGLAIWGGYALYKRTIAKKETKQNDKPPDEEPVVEPSIVKNDTPVTRTVLPPPGSYKFILETSNAERAISRFNKLKTYQWDVRMETLDSVSYKIYMVLPASAIDTTRIRDSLSLLTGKKVYIE